MSEITAPDGRYPDRNALHPEHFVSGRQHLVLTIALSARALAAARAVDPHVSTAAVRAAVEAALTQQQLERTPRQPLIEDGPQ